MGPLPSSNSNMQNEAEANPPRINTPTPESAELLASIANLDNVFLGPPPTLWPEDELQDIEETEVMPIELEDDDFMRGKSDLGVPFLYPLPVWAGIRLPASTCTLPTVGKYENVQKR